MSEPCSREKVSSEKRLEKCSAIWLVTLGSYLSAPLTMSATRFQSKLSGTVGYHND